LLGISKSKIERLRFRARNNLSSVSKRLKKQTEQAEAKDVNHYSIKPELDIVFSDLSSHFFPQFSQ